MTDQITWLKKWQDRHFGFSPGRVVFFRLCYLIRYFPGSVVHVRAFKTSCVTAPWFAGGGLASSPDVVRERMDTMYRLRIASCYQTVHFCCCSASLLTSSSRCIWWGARASLRHNDLSYVYERRSDSTPRARAASAIKCQEILSMSIWARRPCRRHMLLCTSAVKMALNCSLFFMQAWVIHNTRTRLTLIYHAEAIPC